MLKQNILQNNLKKQKTGETILLIFPVLCIIIQKVVLKNIFLPYQEEL